MATVAVAAKFFAIACCVAAAVTVGTKQAKSQAATVAPTTLECGSTTTNSTSGADLIGNAKPDASFLFCPNTTGLAQISTCNSNVETWLYIRGPGIDFSCNDCGDCQRARRAEGSLRFVAGECYEIFVEAAEGEYTISMTCTNETDTPANNTCPIYAVGNDMPSELRRFADSVTVRDRVADFEAALSDGLPPESQVLLDLGLTRNLQPDTLSKLDRSILEDGIHLVMFKDTRNPPRLITDLVGSRFFTRACEQVQELQLTGGGFATGPAELVQGSFTNPQCVFRRDLPSSVDGFYGRLNSLAWTIPHGKGRITYIGASLRKGRFQIISEDGRNLLQSSIGSVCKGGNLTNISNAIGTNMTPVDMTCDSIVQGAVVQGSTVDDAHFAKHRFCTPEVPEGKRAGDRFPVQFSTCGSSISTGLTAFGPGLDLRCFDGSCGTAVRGPCFERAEARFNIRYGECFEVNVYGSLSELGNYSLWTSCCGSSFVCNGRGRGEHIRWGPPLESDPGSASDVCRCICDYPFTGARCDSCRIDDFVAFVFVNGACENCILELRTGLVALHDTTFVWDSDNYVQPGCASNPAFTRGLGFIASESSLVEASQITNPKIELSLSSCTVESSRPLISNLQVSLRMRRSTRDELACAPKIVCDSLPRATKSAKIAFHILSLPPRDPEFAVAMLSFLELLHKTFDGTSSTVLISDAQNSFSNSLDSSSIASSQEFLNFLLKQPGPSCADPGNLALPNLDPDVEILVLVGCVFSGGIEVPVDLLTNALEPVRSGRQLVLLGSSIGPPPSFLEFLPVGDYVTDVFPLICATVTAFINASGQCSKEDVKFEPAVAVALARNTLEFPGLCDIVSCCVGGKCSSFVENGGFRSVTCRIPLLEPGSYNVTVTFVDGQEVLVPPNLTLLRPTGPPRGTVTIRERNSSVVVQGIFLDWKREISHRSPRSFCDLVAISYDLVIMGRIGELIGPSFPGQERIIPVPKIDDPMPFPHVVRFVALRCFEAARFFAMAGQSCSLPEASGPNRSASEEAMNPPWIQRRTQEYIDAAVALVNATNGSANGRAMDVIPKALRVAGLASRLPGERAEDGSEVEYIWSAFAKTAGPYLLSAGFEEVQTNWTLLNAKKGDIVVLPAFNLTYNTENGTEMEFKCGYGYLAMKISNTSNRWVSDRILDLGIFDYMVSIDVHNESLPKLYRLKHDTQLVPENGEYLLPLPLKHQVFQSRIARVAMHTEYSALVPNIEEAVAEDVDRFPCPAVWQRPRAGEGRTGDPGNMPAGLEPIGFDLWEFDPESPQYIPFCFESPTNLRRPFGVRCCYNGFLTYIQEWPSRVLLGGPNWLWSSVEEADAEELLYRDQLFTVVSVTTTSTTNFIIFDGIRTASSMYPGEVNITWDRAAINVSALGNGTNGTSTLNLGNATYFLLSSENENQLVETGNSSILDDRSGVIVHPLGDALSAQVDGFEPNSTQFLLVLAVVNDTVSNNRQATKIRVSSINPVLTPGVKVVEAVPSDTLEINVTQSPNGRRVTVFLVSDEGNLPVLAVGDYLSGFSTQGEPFFLLIHGVSTSPTLVTLNATQARLEEVYETVQFDSIVTVPANDAETAPAEGSNLLQIGQDPKNPNRFEKKFEFAPDPLEWEIIEGLKVFSEFSVTVTVELELLKNRFRLPTIFASATLEYKSKTGITFKKTLEGEEGNFRNIPIPPPTPIPIPTPFVIPLFLLIKPRLEFFATAKWSATIAVEVVQTYNERLSYSVRRENSEWTGTYKRDNPVSLLGDSSSLEGAVSSSFGLEFAASVLVNGLFGLDFGAKASFDTNIEAVIPSDELLQERGIPNGQFLRELDALRGFHVTRFDMGLTITATVQTVAGLVSLDFDSLFSPIRRFLDDDADQALDNFIAKFDKPLLQQPFTFTLWKAPKLGLVKNPDTCGWDIVQEEKAVGFDVMDYTEFKDQYLVDPGGHSISCVAGFRILSDNCIGNDFLIFGPFFDPDDRKPTRSPEAEGYVYAFRTWRRLGLIRFLATTIFRDHHFDYSCDNPSDNLVKVEEAYDQAFAELQELLRKLRDIQENRVEAFEFQEVEAIEPPTPVTPAGEGGPRFGGGRTRRVDDPLRFTSGGIPYLERTGPIKRTKDGLPIGESLSLGPGGPNLGPITFLPPDPSTFDGGGGGGSRRTRRGGAFPITPLPSNQPFRDSDWNLRRREGFGGGDPQCSSYDGFRFECNFLGEALWTRCGTFAVHVFAEKPSSTSRATVIKGFAVKETNATDLFIAALTEEQNSSFEFALNGEEGALIGNFLVGTLTGTQLLLESDEGHRVKATFRQIDIFLEVTLPDSCFNESSGLLGNNNGDATDDLNASTNQVLSVNASGKTIYEDFVLSWCVTDFSSSLFPPRLWHPCNTSWVPLFVDELDLAACPDACGNSGFCCLDSSEVGEDFAVKNDQTVRVTLAEQEVTAWPFSAIPPQLFLPEEVFLPPPSASELQVTAAVAATAPVSFTVFALANSEPELNCSICRRAEVLCEVTGPSLSNTSLFNVSLSVTGQSLPPGSSYCVATANGLSAIGGVQLLQAPLLPTTTTSAETMITTSAASTGPASTTTSAAPTAAASTTTSAAPTAAALKTTSAAPTAAASTTTSAAPTAAASTTTAAEPFGTGTTSTRDSLTTCLNYTCMQDGFVRNAEAKNVACVGACDDDTCCVATCATFSCPGPWPVRPDEVCGATSDTCNFATCCLRKRFRRRRNRRNRGAYHYSAGRQGLGTDNDSLQITTEEIMFMQEDFDEL